MQGVSYAMKQTQAEENSVQADNGDWSRSEWFGLVGGYRAMPAEEPVNESPAQVRTNISTKPENPAFLHDREK